MKEISKEWNYQCPSCPQIFSRAEAFQKHSKKSHGVKLTACRSCPMFFDELNLLFLHARQIHNIKSREEKKDCKHNCLYFPACTYQTDNGGLMKHHLRSHTNYKPYECAICHKRFTQKSNMKTHFNRHKKNQFKFECFVCEKSFSSYDIYLSHLETREHYFGEILSKHEVHFRCMVCQEIFHNPVDTYYHPENCKCYEDYQFSCNICYALLPTDLPFLDQHHKNHKNELVCPFCDEITVFTDKTAFNFHVTKKHNAKVDRRKACRYCESIFENEEERNKHIEIEHQNMKNKHQMNKLDGRIRCDFHNCVFTSNSEIMIQKHLHNHYKNLDLDMFYKDKIKMESDNSPIEKSKKRGRPRLCDSNDTHDSTSVTTPENNEPKKKRGRPKKSESNNDSNNSHTVNHKRSKIEKVKIEKAEFENCDFLNFVNVEETEFNIDHIDTNFMINETFTDSTNYNQFLRNDMKIEEIETFEV